MIQARLRASEGFCEMLGSYVRLVTEGGYVRQSFPAVWELELTVLDDVQLGVKVSVRGIKLLESYRCQQYGTTWEVMESPAAPPEKRAGKQM